MKRTLALLALSAFPIAASAQMAPAPPAMGPRASATTASGRTTGITVSAAEMSPIAATTAQVLLSLGGATPQTQIDTATVQPIVDALTAAGAQVTLPPGFAAGGYANNAQITATVKNPTSEMMKSGILTVGAAAAKLPSLRIYNAQVTLRASDCSSAVTKARSAAISLARRKAEETAKELGVHVGAVISVNAYDQSSIDSSCTSQYSVGPGGPQFYSNGYNIEQNDYTTIPVVANVTITFAIR